MANIILRAATSWTEEQYQELQKNGADPLIINILGRPVIMWQSSWKWNPCPSLKSSWARDIDAEGTGNETIWAEYAHKKLICI